MWILKGIDGYLNGAQIWICPGKPLAFGRKVTCTVPPKDPNTILITIQDDSVSRAHATVSLEHDKTTDTWIPVLTDTNSKYGTYLYNDNDLKIKPQTQYRLQTGQTIRFGTYNTLFCLENTRGPIVSYAPSMFDDERTRIVTLCERYGFSHTDYWSEKSTHLVVTKASIKEQLLLALIDEKPIVSLSWLESFHACQVYPFSMPKPRDHIPEITAEAPQSLSSYLLQSALPECERSEDLHPGIKRRIVAKGNTVISFSESEELSRLINKTGGKFAVVQMDLRTRAMFYNDLVQYVKKHPNSVCVFQSERDNPLAEWERSELSRLMENEKLRFVNVEDIRQAIVHGDWKTYCSSLCSRREELETKSRMLAYDVDESGQMTNRYSKLSTNSGLMNPPIEPICIKPTIDKKFVRDFVAYKKAKDRYEQELLDREILLAQSKWRIDAPTSSMKQSSLKRQNASLYTENNRVQSSNRRIGTVIAGTRPINVDKLKRQRMMERNESRSITPPPVQDQKKSEVVTNVERPVSQSLRKIQSKCFEAMHALRGDIVGRLMIDAPDVFVNSTLVDIAKALPETREQFEQICDMTNEKWEKYGLQFLKVTKRHAEMAKKEE